MRFMIIVKATKNSEAGVMPSEQLLSEMGKYNKELVNAGVILAGEGAPGEFEGCAREGLWTYTDSDRWTVCRNKGTDCRLLDLAVQVEGRGDRMGQAVPQSDAERGIRDRDSPGVRGGGFRAEFTPELREQEERLRTH